MVRGNPASFRSRLDPNPCHHEQDPHPGPSFRLPSRRRLRRAARRSLAVRPIHRALEHRHQREGWHGHPFALHRHGGQQGLPRHQRPLRHAAEQQPRGHRVLDHGRDQAAARGHRGRGHQRRVPLRGQHRGDRQLLRLHHQPRRRRERRHRAESRHRQPHPRPELGEPRDRELRDQPADPGRHVQHRRHRDLARSEFQPLRPGQRLRHRQPPAGLRQPDAGDLHRHPARGRPRRLPHRPRPQPPAAQGQARPAHRRRGRGQGLRARALLRGDPPHAGVGAVQALP